MENQRISCPQAILLLTLSRVFNTLSYIPTFSIKVTGTTAIIGIILSFVQQAIIIIPALLLYKKYPGKSIVDVCYEKSKAFGSIVTVLFLFAIFFVTAGGVTGFNFFMTNAIYPDAPIAVIAISICLVCFLSIRNGLQGITRASSILFFCFLIGFIFIGAIAMGSVKLLNFHPMLENPTKSILYFMFDTTAKSAEPMALVLLFPRINGSKTKTAYWFLGISLVISLITTFLVTGVLGDFSSSQTFPYFTLTSVIRLKIFQRLDSIHMVTWVFASFIHITLFAGILTNLLKKLLPKAINKLSGILLFFAVTFSSIWLSFQGELIKAVSVPSNILPATLWVLLPLVLLFIKKGNGNDKDEKKKDIASTNSVS